MRKFYRSLDGRKTMDEILRSMHFPRVQLINVLYHLVINDLVRISSAIVIEKAEEMHPRAIDSVAIQGVMMNLRRLETGMFIYPAFLYFLEQEYFRCHRSNTPLSVIVFEIRVLGAGAVLEMLPAPAVLDAVLRISQLKRHVDLIAHYDQFDYALLLPNTKANGAQIFAKRIVKALTDTPLAGNVDASKLCISLGCASMPEDFTELSELLGAADMAMTKSRTSQRQVVMFRDIKAQ
jgi:GGDEF domain-containing protein